MKKQQRAYDLLAPHYRILQFLSSHFHATRLGSPHIQKVYQRLMHVALGAMKHTCQHPLAREVHLHILLLGLRILKFNTDTDPSALWRLKDLVLTAALAWFQLPPR